jgi:hypothetical protein
VTARFERAARAAWLAIAVIAPPVLAASPAAAQPRRPPPPAPSAGSWEIGGGVVWIRGVDFGEHTAELARNPGTGTGPFDLFTTTARLTEGVGFQGHLAVYLSRSIAVEGGIRYTPPKLRIHISADAENAADQVADETIGQYLFDGSFVYHFSHATFSRGRGIAFVSAGAGYLRDVHEDNALIETGTEYHATGGIKYFFDARPRSHRFGMRGEAGFSIRDGGFDFEDKLRTVPIVMGSLMYLF